MGADTYREDKSGFMDEFESIIVTKDNDEAGLASAMAVANDHPEKP